MVLVLLLVGCDVYNFDFVWAPMMIGKSPIYCVFMSVLFNVTTSLLLVSYLRCIFTSSAQRVYLTIASMLHKYLVITIALLKPFQDNSPPADWDVNDPTLKKCTKCTAYGGVKAARTHHCSMCGEVRTAIKLFDFISVCT
jgi:hypothetical protein